MSEHQLKYRLVLFRQNAERIVLQDNLDKEEADRYTNSDDTKGDGWFFGRESYAEDYDR